MTQGTDRLDRAGLCAFLRDARERVGLTLDDLARTTRIQPHVLHQLEGGDLASLPAPVFVRGFLRQIAREVRADGEEAVRRYDDAMEQMRVERIPAPVPVGDQASALDGRRRFAVALFVLILIVIVTITVSLLLKSGAPSDRGVSRREAPIARAQAVDAV